MLDIRRVSQSIASEENSQIIIFPLKHNIFRIFDAIPLEGSKIKVVILGMDPYPGFEGTLSNPQAQGYSFSLHRDAKISPSLMNIYKEIERTIPGFLMPCHGDLSAWVEQGIFLLNTALTVRAGTPGSHIDIWSGFTDKILSAIGKYCPHTIYVLWGANAKKMRNSLSEKAVLITNPEQIQTLPNDRPVILESSHPAARDHSFINNGHFLMMNAILKRRGLKTIDWNIPV